MKTLSLFLLSCFLFHASTQASPVSPQPAASAFFNQPLAAPTLSRIGSLQIETYGQGSRTLILIPGLSCGSWVWWRTVDAFASEYRVVVVTLPGFDRNPALKSDSLFQAATNDLWQLVRIQADPHPVLVGHSLGGTLALEMAIAHSYRLGGVIAIDGLPVFPALPNATAEQRKASAAQAYSTLAALDQAQWIAQNESYMSAIGTNQPNLVHPAAELASKSDLLSVAQWMKEDLETDLRPSLSKVTIPVLELAPYDTAVGTSPRYTAEQTREFYQYLLSGVPRCTTEIISPSRHFVMFDQPEKVNQDIRAFLAALK